MRFVPPPRDERGVTTAEYAVGTLGAAAIGTCVYRVAAPFLERLIKPPPPGALDDLLRRFVLFPQALQDWLPWA